MSQENLNINKLLKEKWDINLNSFWTPLNGEPDKNVCYFKLSEFNDFYSFKRLCTIINERSNTQIFEVNELKEIKKHTNLSIDGYNGLDTFYFSSICDWVIYITHEDTIAIAGKEVIANIKTDWKENYKYINPWENDYFEKELIRIRKPIWKNISLLFLGRELTKTETTEMIRVIKQSELSIEEIQEIELFEVFPAIKNNSLRVDDKWQEFNEDWLTEKCLSNHYKKESRFWRSLVKFKSKHLFSNRLNKWNQIINQLESDT